MDEKRRREALKVIKSLNATKKSKSLKDMIEELESKVESDSEVKEIEDNDEAKRATKRVLAGFPADYDVEEDLDDEDKKKK